jgi:shikimate kinase
VIHLSLIGMSGAGKSFWAQKLAAAGFRAVSIDDRIEQKLASELAAGGYRGIGGVAAWMGWPHQPGYQERASEYLAREIESMNEVLDEIEKAPGDGIVLDTTGSVVYTGDEICRRLRRVTLVVYLEAGLAEEKTLMARYLSDPKPVLWGDQFSPRPEETTEATVSRCYPLLIAHRKRLYRRYAHRVVAMKRLRDPALDARGFLELVVARAKHA